MDNNPVIKTEEEPATDALEYLLQDDDPASLMFDLREMLQRDPTLSSLNPPVIKPEEPALSGMPIPSSISPIPQQPAPSLENNPFGNSSSSVGSSTSPVVFGQPAPQQQQQGSLFGGKPVFQTQQSFTMDTSETSTNPTSPGFPKLELGDLDVDLNDYFTNETSKNVSFGVPYSKQTTTPKVEEVSIRPQRSQQQAPPASQFWQQEDNLLFASSSISTHSGGVTFGPSQPQQQQQQQQQQQPQGTSALLSSSVPANILQNNSPLSDILADLSPSASAMDSANLGPSHAGPERHSTLHKLLLRRDPHRPPPVRSPDRGKTLEQIRSSLSASNPLLTQQLSKSAPNSSQQQQPANVWSRREPRQHISSVCSVGNDSSIQDEVNDVLSGLSPTDLPDIVSDDEEDDEDNSEELGNSDLDDSDDDEETSQLSNSGENSSSTPKPRSRAGSASSKRGKYFWMYNVQAKGPKGQKIVVETKMEDPHVLNDIVDPVFSGDVQLQGIKHSGKARKGDGNDLTANPKKLAAIGKELDHLTAMINDIAPASEMPFNARCKSRKEKNKLASRACRLKKKAQHEANKLKCYGLEQEHRKSSEYFVNICQ